MTTANRHNELVAFVLDQAESVPIARRARLYRALADIVGVPEEADQLNTMAAALEQAEALCREFKFSFSQKLSA